LQRGSHPHKTSGAFRCIAKSAPLERIVKPLDDGLAVVFVAVMDAVRAQCAASAPRARCAAHKYLHGSVRPSQPASQIPVEDLPQHVAPGMNSRSNPERKTISRSF